MRHFADRLTDAVEQKQSQLVVGLDPLPDRVPDPLSFCRGIIDAVADYAVAVKPQSAFFEVHGADGVRAFEETCAYAHAAGLLVIGDVKRGDIPTTAEAYAQAFIPLADAVTVNPYLGGDSVEPFIAACRREGAGIFCLVKTSNAGSADVQDLELADGRLLWQQVAQLVDYWGRDILGENGRSAVGAVVGATYPKEVAAIRELLPRSVLLLLGIGAQGAKPKDVAPAFSAGRASALVSTSRSVIFADSPAAEAKRLAGEIWALSTKAALTTPTRKIGAGSSGAYD
jgi:orotidine-5'-phosphate decarboxylase